MRRSYVPEWERWRENDVHIEVSRGLTQRYLLSFFQPIVPVLFTHTQILAVEKELCIFALASVAAKSRWQTFVTVPPKGKARLSSLRCICREVRFRRLLFEKRPWCVCTCFQHKKRGRTSFLFPRSPGGCSWSGLQPEMAVRCTTGQRWLEAVSLTTELLGVIRRRLAREWRSELWLARFENARIHIWFVWVKFDRRARRLPWVVWVWFSPRKHVCLQLGVARQKCEANPFAFVKSSGWTQLTLRRNHRRRTACHRLLCWILLIAFVWYVCEVWTFFVLRISVTKSFRRLDVRNHSLFLILLPGTLVLTGQLRATASWEVCNVVAAHTRWLVHWHSASGGISSSSCCHWGEHQVRFCTSTGFLCSIHFSWTGNRQTNRFGRDCLRSRKVLTLQRRTSGVSVAMFGRIFFELHKAELVNFTHAETSMELPNRKKAVCLFSPMTVCIEVLRMEFFSFGFSLCFVWWAHQVSLREGKASGIRHT